jgi:hypothetical protein
MNLELFVPLLITVVVAIFGWYFVHALAMRRDRAAKGRDLRVQFLIEAYRRLESVSNRPFSKETARSFESAIADIQLFGTPDQVRLAQEFAAGYAEKGKHPIQPLLAELRNELRRELQLEVTAETLKALRIKLPEGEPMGSDSNDT